MASWWQKTLGFVQKEAQVAAPIVGTFNPALGGILGLAGGVVLPGTGSQGTTGQTLAAPSGILSALQSIGSVLKDSHVAQLLQGKSLTITLTTDLLQDIIDVEQRAQALLVKLEKAVKVG